MYFRLSPRNTRSFPSLATTPLAHSFLHAFQFLGNLTHHSHSCVGVLTNLFFVNCNLQYLRTSESFASFRTFALRSAECYMFNPSVSQPSSSVPCYCNFHYPSYCIIHLPSVPPILYSALTYFVQFQQTETHRATSPIRTHSL